MFTDPSSAKNGFIFQRGLAGGNVEFIFDVAHQLFENVFHRDDSGGRAETRRLPLRDAAALFEFGEQFTKTFGSTAGVITVEDILEQLVGNIEDEFDVSPRAALEDESVLRLEGSGEHSRPSNRVRPDVAARRGLKLWRDSSSHVYRDSDAA